MTLLLLAGGGLVLGSFLASGAYMLRYEPEARTAYAVIGLGILASVAASVGLEVDRGDELPDPYRLGTLVAYAVVAVGLVLLVRTRRDRHR